MEEYAYEWVLKIGKHEEMKKEAMYLLDVIVISDDEKESLESEKSLETTACTEQKKKKDAAANWPAWGEPEKLNEESLFDILGEKTQGNQPRLKEGEKVTWEEFTKALKVYDANNGGKKGVDAAKWEESSRQQARG